MANTASQKDLFDTIWHATRGFIGKELLLESKLVPVPYLSNADDFGLFSVFVKSKSVTTLFSQTANKPQNKNVCPKENVSQKIKHSLAGACYHVIGHVSQVIELEKTDLDRLLNSAKPHTEDVGNQSEKWEKDIDLGSKSVHLTVEGLHKFLIPLNLSEGDLCLKQNIPDLVGAKSVYIITDVMKASRVTACVTSDDDTMERVSAVSVPIGFGYSKFRLTPEGLVAEQMKCKPAIHGKWVVVINQLSEILNKL
ncbi:hypothetical protein OUZ56_002804 [Daphnia magna]|uniref:Uncharacterized protein n=1 Tax=Daphnia magna TaxID=35525 RepID=A0ABR0A7B4_9CRUS|nr:hypothetical protein OUZ56_002804 [Daphnia magna]